MTDIHSHLVAAIDDGPSTWNESLAMARMAAADGIATVIATPHQLGNFAHNDGQRIRHATGHLAELVRANRIPLTVLPGADVRIEPDIVPKIVTGEIVTLADWRRHLLLELPHELYFHLRPLGDTLRRAGIRGILSHPERNHGLLARPHLVGRLVDDGWLMQITAGSLVGTFGPDVQRLAQWMVQSGLVHIVATDAHGSRSRRPLLSRAFRCAEELAGRQTAIDLFCRNPADVAAGHEVAGGKQPIKRRRITRWFGRASAG